VNTSGDTWCATAALTIGVPRFQRVQATHVLPSQRSCRWVVAPGGPLVCKWTPPALLPIPTSGPQRRGGPLTQVAASTHAEPRQLFPSYF
jgi:hypothetical protein